MNQRKFFDSKAGWLIGAAHLRSPNCDDRPENCPIDLCVIHNISLPPGHFGGPEVGDFFLNQLDCSIHPYFKKLIDVHVSSHIFIRRTGAVIQFVPFHKRAWHAGVSSFQGQPECNNYSIGIELEGTDYEAFTEDQYITLAAVIFAVQQEYPQIDLTRIVGHSDIAPDRKTDPGPFFDWEKLQMLL